MKTREAELAYIVSTAEKVGLNIHIHTVKPLPTHGFMSEVFSVESNRGKVILHSITTPVAEQEYQHVPEKIGKVSSILQHVAQVPKVYLTGHFPHHGYFMIQEYKSGTPLGRRVYADGKFNDIFLLDTPEPYLAKLQDIALQLHKVEAGKFGYIDCTKEKPDGTHDTWEGFLTENYERTLQTLLTSQEEHGIKYFGSLTFDDAREKGISILENNKKLFSIDTPHFIHGDIFNYSNVLVGDGTIHGIVDFEWSLFGHPAWEFVFVEHPPLEQYVQRAVQARVIPKDIDFRRSIELHTIFWCAWGASVHANNPIFGPALFTAFRNVLLHNT